MILNYVRLLNSVYTKTVEINELKNIQLKEVVADKEEILKNGVYGCISRDDGNYYIFINGVELFNNGNKETFKILFNN